MDFCVFLCLCMCEFTCFWVSSNRHCTLFYSDPTRRHKQQAQPHLIICNGNSLHYHNILFQQTFRFPGGRPIGDKNGDWTHVTSTLFPLLPLSIQQVLIYDAGFHGLHRGIFLCSWPRMKRKAEGREAERAYMHGFHACIMSCVCVGIFQSVSACGCF